MRREDNPWVAAALREDEMNKHGVKCPECGSPMNVETDVKTYDPTTEVYSTADAVAFCSGCEFVHEFAL